MTCIQSALVVSCALCFIASCAADTPKSESEGPVGFTRSVRQFRDRPLLDTPNLVVWEKDLGGGRILVMERAYMYPRRDQPGAKAGGAFQFAFVLLDPNSRPSRVMKWVRDVPEEAFMSGIFPDPQIQVLDASMEGSDLLVLFNQYNFCFGYRVEGGDPVDGRATTTPASEPRSRVSDPDPGCVGEAMHEGTIRMLGGNLTVQCRNDAGTFKLQLLKMADGRELWK